MFRSGPFSLVARRAVCLSRASSLSSRALSTAVAAETPEIPVKLFGIHARYATAAFVAASKADVLQQVEMELLAFQDVLAKQSSLAAYVANPTVSRDDKVAKMDAFLGANVSHVTKNTVTALAENARLGEVDKVIEAFAMLIKAQRKEVDAIITSAEPLTNASTRAIKDALEKHAGTGEKIMLTTVVDESLLGGITVQIGDKYMDLSVSSQIAAFKRAL